MQLNVNNQQMIHVLSEIIVFIGITFYFSTRIRNIEKKLTLQNNRINELEEVVDQQKKIIKLILNKLQDNQKKSQKQNDNDNTEECNSENDKENSSLKKRTHDFMNKVAANKKNENEPKIVEITNEEEEEEKEEEEEEEEEEEKEEKEEEEEKEEIKEELVDDIKLQEMIKNELNELELKI